MFHTAVAEQAKEAMFHRTQYLEVTKLSLRYFFLMVVKMINGKTMKKINFPLLFGEGEPVVKPCVRWVSHAALIDAVRWGLE